MKKEIIICFTLKAQAEYADFKGIRLFVSLCFNEARVKSNDKQNGMSYYILI